jgi:hypothetical protein
MLCVQCGPPLGLGFDDSSYTYDGALDRPRFGQGTALRIARSDVEDAILGGHDRCVRNACPADWLVQSGQLVVAYNYPEGDDNDRVGGHAMEAGLA